MLISVVMIVIMKMLVVAFFMRKFATVFGHSMFMFVIMMCHLILQYIIIGRAASNRVFFSDYETISYLHYAENHLFCGFAPHHERMEGVNYLAGFVARTKPMVRKRASSCLISSKPASFNSFGRSSMPN